MPDAHISLIARSDVEIEHIPTERVDATTDTVPAALRGAATGGALGLIGGIVSLAIPPVGITVGGIALMTALAAGVGAWSSALVGSSVPNSVRRRFEQEIEAGRILVVIDDDVHPAGLEAVMSAAGAHMMPFETPSAAA